MIKRRKIKYLSVLCVICMASCHNTKTVNHFNTVKQLDINKYEGTWYEIYRIPVRQEKHLHSVTATYTLNNDNTLTVLNAGYTITNNRKTATGKAWQPDVNEPGKLKVQFFWPFSGDYLILYIDDAYNNVIISGKDGKYAWILSRYPTMDENISKDMLRLAEEKGLDITKFEKVDQGINIKKQTGH